MHPPQAQANHRCGILIAEDNQTNRLLLREYLDPLGVCYHGRWRGAAAIDLWQRWQPHRLDGYAGWPNAEWPGKPPSDFARLEAAQGETHRHRAPNPTL